MSAAPCSAGKTNDESVRAGSSAASSHTLAFAAAPPSFSFAFFFFAPACAFFLAPPPGRGANTVVHPDPALKCNLSFGILQSSMCGNENPVRSCAVQCVHCHNSVCLL